MGAMFIGSRWGKMAPEKGSGQPRQCPSQDGGGLGCIRGLPIDSESLKSGRSEADFGLDSWLGVVRTVQDPMMPCSVLSGIACCISPAIKTFDFERESEQRCRAEADASLPAAWRFLARRNLPAKNHAMPRDNVRENC